MPKIDKKQGVHSIHEQKPCTESKVTSLLLFMVIDQGMSGGVI